MWKEWFEVQQHKKTESQKMTQSPLGTINIELMSNLSYFSKVEIWLSTKTKA